MKRAFSLLAMLCLTTAGFGTEAASLRVRLWSQHVVHTLTLSASPSIQVRTCVNCAPLPGTDFSVTATGAGLQVNDTKIPRLRVNGSYIVRVEGRPVQLSAPLELTARNGRVIITASMPLEEYVAGVLAGEAGGMRSPEALKAMAVAIRTYAVHFRLRHQSENFDFCDSTHCQDLRLSGTSDRVNAAVAATEGELLWYQGSTIASYYHQDCGGTTERGTEDLSARGRVMPYLPQQSDSWCPRRGSAQWQSTIAKNDLARALRAAGLRVPANIRSVSVGSRSPSGRVAAVRIAGEFGATVAEDRFHLAVGRALGWQHLRSSMYDISDRGEGVTFTGRGNGHGVGLCQAGASVMGNEGHDYREILAYYYPHTAVGLTAQGLRWTSLGGARIDLLTIHPQSDGPLLSQAERLLSEAEQRSGIVHSSTRPILRVYPTLDAFRDATGEPGWVAASTRGNVIRLQPPDVLQRTRSLDAVLRHEFLHLLVQSKSRPDTPLWLREGLVLWLNGDAARSRRTTMSLAQVERSLRSPASQEDLRAAYAAAQAQVAILARRNGKPGVIAMLSDGLPAELRGN